MAAHLHSDQLHSVGKQSAFVQTSNGLWLVESLLEVEVRVGSGSQRKVEMESRNQQWRLTWKMGSSTLLTAIRSSDIAAGMQDTIRRPKVGSEAGQMKKATTLAIGITTSFYMAVGTIGYGAFGDDAPTNLLTGFGFFNPYWLIDIANVFVMVHLVGAYQVWVASSPPIGYCTHPLLHKLCCLASLLEPCACSHLQSHLMQHLLGVLRAAHST